ncbi:MAG: hypothetical protein ACK4FF_10300 [Limnobacter sp.]|uniref:hypothetical protein n=1 Tax=Limnobacter sp. TaxID=2003368 RepID=UPI00391AA99E
MIYTETSEWVPEFIIRAPGFAWDLAQISKSVGVPTSFLDDLLVSLQLNEPFWLNSHLQNLTKGPTLDFPVDVEGQLRYVLGWLTVDCYRITIEKWGESDPFFSKLSKLTNALYQLEAFKNSNVYQNLRSDTKLKFGNRESVPRGSAPLAELLNNTGMSNCRGLYPQVILWIIERNYQAYLHSNRTTLLTRQAFELINILRNINNGETWDFLSERIRTQKWNYNYFKFRQTIIQQIFHGNLELESDKFQVSQRIRYLAQKLDEMRAQPIIFLSSVEQPVVLTDNSVNAEYILAQIDMTGEEDMPATGNKKQTSNDQESNKKDIPSERKKKSTRQQTVLKRPKTIDDENRSWQRSIEESIWSAANPYVNDRVEDFVSKFEPNADIPENIRKVLQDDLEVTEKDIEILATVVWLQMKTSQPLRNLALTENAFNAQEEWRFNPELTKLHRIRPQFDPQSNVECDHLPNDVLTVQYLDLPSKVVNVLSKYRIFKIPLLELLKQPTEGLERPKDHNGSSSSKESGEKTPSQVIERLLHCQNKLSKALQIDHFNWPCHCLRIIHNRKTRNLTEGQLLYIRPNEQRDASTAYYRKNTNEGINIAGSVYCPNISKAKEHLDLILHSIESKIKGKDLYEFWNSLTDLIILYLSITTASRPLLDPFAELVNFDFNNHLLILKDKDLDSRNSTRVVPLVREISSWLKDVYFPLLRELSHRTENKRLAAMIEALSDSESPVQQKIPLFFHISPRGVEHIGENWIYKYFNHKGIVSNLARHLSSTYLDLSDRELNDLLLGHQHLGLPLHGTCSARVRDKDIDAIRTGTSEHLKRLLTAHLPLVEFPSDGRFKGHQHPKSFGEEKRRRERSSKFGRLRTQIESLADDVNKLPYQQRVKAANETLILIKSTEKYQDSCRALASHFCKCIDGVDPDLLNHKTWERVQEKNPIDVKWMQQLHKRKIIESKLENLICDHQLFKSVSDLNLLFSFSLIIYNGVTDWEVHRSVLKEEYKCFSLFDEVYIEFSFEEGDPNFAATRRHQLSQQSVNILQRLKNGRGRSKKISPVNQKISDDLRYRINQINLGGADSLSIVEQLIILEKAFQIYHLPTPIAQIASGEIPHRSMCRASLAAHKRGIRIFNLAESFTPIIPSQQSRKKLDVTIHQLLELAATLTNQSQEFLYKVSHIKPLESAALALKEYLVDLFTRSHLGRPLATSTKAKYISKIRHFLESTEVIYFIAINDPDGVNEEILEFLEKLGRKNSEGAEYARHIYAYFDTRALAFISEKVYVPYLQKIFKPRVTVYTPEEINLVARKLLNGSHLQALHLLNFIADFGIRTFETSLIKCSKVHIKDKKEIRIYLRGNSSHRLKTTRSNRIILPLEVCGDFLTRSLIEHVEAKQSLDPGSLVIDSSFNEALVTLKQAISKYIGRGQVYSLRHFFADQLFTPILRQSLGLEAPEVELRLNKLNGGPQDSYTLYFAGRLLGHTSPKTSLTHYYHRGFELIDEYYAKNRGLQTKISDATVFFPPMIGDEAQLAILPKSGNPGVFQENAFRICAQVMTSIAGGKVTSDQFNLLAGHIEVSKTRDYLASLPAELQLGIKGKSKRPNGAIIHLKYLDEVASRPSPTIVRFKSITKFQTHDFLGMWTRSQMVVSLPETIDQDLSMLSLIVSNLGLQMSNLSFFTSPHDRSALLHEKCITKGMQLTEAPIRHLFTQRNDGRSPREEFVCIRARQSTESASDQRPFTLTNSVLFAEACVLAILTSFCNTLII